MFWLMLVINISKILLLNLWSHFNRDFLLELLLSPAKSPKTFLTDLALRG